MMVILEAIQKPDKDDRQPEGPEGSRETMSEPCDEQVLDSQSPDLTEEEPHARQILRKWDFSQSVVHSSC